MSRKDYEEEKLKETEVEDNDDDQLLYDNETKLERRDEIMGFHDDQYPEDPYITDDNGERIYL